MNRRLMMLIVAACLFLGTRAGYAKMIESEKSKVPTQKQRLEKVQARVDELNQKLFLSDEQKKTITEIITRTKEATMNLLQETGDKITEIKSKAELEIEGVLTKEQKEKLKDVAAEKDEEAILKIFKGY